MCSSYIQPKQPVQHLSSFSKSAVQSEILGSYQGDSKVKEQSPSGYWDSEQEAKASIKYTCVYYKYMKIGIKNIHAYRSL